MKLKHLIHNLFEKKHLRDQEKLATDFDVLSEYLPQMFPRKADWEQVMADLDHDVDHRAVSYTNLPFHTRDDAWLAKYAQSVVAANDSNANVKTSNARYFVKYSGDFDYFRGVYERNLTKGQIEYIINHHTSQFLPKEYAQYYIYNQPNYDKLFREGVVESMNILGVDQQNTEYALESNAELWRPQAMRKSFQNHYFPDLIGEDGNIFPWWKYYKSMNAYRNVWIKLREYQYYHAHKDVIDELGVQTDDMLLSPKEVMKLTHEAVKYHKKFSTLIGNFQAQQDQIKTEQNQTQAEIDKTLGL